MKIKEEFKANKPCYIGERMVNTLDKKVTWQSVLTSVEIINRKRSNVN
jgi:hypothetical protein